MPDGLDLRGYVVMDARGRTVGPVASYWTEPGSSRVLFAGVKTGIARAGLRVVPLHHARLDEERRLIHVPYPRERALEAPTHGKEEPMDREVAERVLLHYRQAPEGTEPRPEPQAAEVLLHEEKVHVATRVVEAGGVRLRKVVRREVVHVPVEVLREEILVERVEPGEAPSARAAAPGIPDEPFREGALFIPTWREEPLVSKTTEVVGAVRANKAVETREETVRAQARREEVEVAREPPRPGEDA